MHEKLKPEPLDSCTQKLSMIGLPELATLKEKDMNQRKIVICSDGTWNSSDDEDRGVRRPTNIAKISRAILPADAQDVSQIVFYDEGVGTSLGQKLIGGVTGYGLSKNVLDCYRFLSDNYREGDLIYLFGFSRGAYTVRSLCGFINKVGIVSKGGSYFTPELYRLYKDDADAATIDAFYESKNNTTRVMPRIRMIGVFDTVGSLGLPFEAVNEFLTENDLAEFQFHDVTLSPIVDYAYQALAVDEKRKPFVPAIWSSASEQTQEMEQMWFAGVHSNIGGGYKPDGLANQALHYIVEKAKNAGLEFDPTYLTYFEKHYDSELRNSMSFKYRLLGEHNREITLGTSSNEKVDGSVYERIEHVKKYKPINVP